MTLETALFCFLGMVIGSVITQIFLRLTATKGILHIDRSDPGGDLYRFQIFGDLNDLDKKTRVIFKIDHKADLSQK